MSREYSKILRFVSVLAFTLFYVSCGDQQSKVNVWQVTQPEWGQAAEDDFARFVKAIGEGRAQKRCLM